MRYLQQQVRLCSTGTLQPQRKAEDYEDSFKLVQIPPAAHETRSKPIEHDTDNGILFKVRSSTM